jgi:two-component system, NtrC family, sensor kinase
VTLGNRIGLALGVAGLVPVAVLGWQAVRGAREELTSSVGGALVRQADEMARDGERSTLDRLKELRQAASYIPFDRLSRDETTAALAIPYRQFANLNILAVVEREGRTVANVVSEPHPELDPSLVGHEPIDQRDLEAFSHAVPLDAALQAGLAVGPPYRSPVSGLPRLALAVRLDQDRGRILAAELSLGDLSASLQETAGEGVAYLVDGGGRRLTGADPGSLSKEEVALVTESAASARPLVRLVERGDGRAWLAAHAPAGALGWGVVIAQPTAVAFRAADRVQRQALWWSLGAVLLSTGLGIVLWRALKRPLQQLTDAVGALRDGHYDAPLPATGQDELGLLSETFANMAREVRRRDEEIQAFNSELRERVEARTQELRSAEDQIARNRHLTALGSISAGVAHGINNPMTSVIGLVTMARDKVGPDSEPGQLLGTALAEARRVTGVVRDLRRLAAPGLAEGARRFPLDRAVNAAVQRFRAIGAPGPIELSVNVDRDLPEMEGDPEQIESLLDRLLQNAAASTPPGGQVSVSVSSVEGAALRLVVSDTGRGIPPELRDRIFDPFFSTSQAAGAGLGLSLVHGIVEAHHGRIEVASEPWRETTFTIHFPAAAAPPHLA